MKGKDLPQTAFLLNPVKVLETLFTPSLHTIKLGMIDLYKIIFYLFTLPNKLHTSLHKETKTLNIPPSKLACVLNQSLWGYS